MTLVMMAMLAAAGVAQSTHAQNAAVPIQEQKVFGDWVMHCPDLPDLPPCEIVQTAKDKQSGEQVSRISLAYAGKEDRYGFQVVLPLGIQIQAGGLVRIDEATDISGLHISRCETQGCFLEGVLASKDIAPFSAGRKAMVAAIARDGKPFVIPVSLGGFTEALAAMTTYNRNWAQKAESKRNKK